MGSRHGDAPPAGAGSGALLIWCGGADGRIRTDGLLFTKWSRPVPQAPGPPVFSRSRSGRLPQTPASTRCIPPAFPHPFPHRRSW